MEGTPPTQTGRKEEFPPLGVCQLQCEGRGKGAHQVVTTEAHGPCSQRSMSWNGEVKTPTYLVQTAARERRRKAHVQRMHTRARLTGRSTPAHFLLSRHCTCALVVKQQLSKFRLKGRSVDERERLVTTA